MINLNLNDAARNLFSTVAKIHKDLNHLFHELVYLFRNDYLADLEKNLLRIFHIHNY